MLTLTPQGVLVQFLDTLQGYVKHDVRCRSHEAGPCTCGLDELLAHIQVERTRAFTHAAEFAACCRECQWVAGPFVLQPAAYRWARQHERQESHAVRVVLLVSVRQRGPQGPRDLA